MPVTKEQAAKNIRSLVERLEGEYINAEISRPEYNRQIREINKRCLLIGIGPLGKTLKGQ